MLYFIAWVVVMLAAIVAVPVASMLENRQRRPSGGDAADRDEAELADDDDDLQPLDDDQGGLEEGAVDAEGQSPEDAFDTGAPDDFSAFEEEFK